ncbi:LysR substrate-binding domain-containing protein [Arvimicrobium flavum]|uniref:LysR substrate-binding domain-containing protein n=1 Tax=Arvimicrobium flavum TaxID=3393320 RepID=UPI00237B662C|nr:LysR substrate-binding domain-containing protein [Mesorhizobium shangrilense]
MRRLNSVHLNGLRAVESVTRLGSLQKAGDELGVSSSAVSQQVARTEAQFGRPLFTRTRTGLVPTEFGTRIAARLTAGFRELDEAIALAEEQATNTLTVSVAPAFASRFLVPRLSRFFALHPEILFRIDASTNLVDLEASGVDLAIRLGNGDWPRVQTEKLIDMDVFPICAPSIASRLQSIQDLARVHLISDISTMISWDDWFAAAGVKPVKSLEGISFTDVLLCLDAVLSGHGVMLGWQMLAGDALADGRLVEPFGVRARTGFAHYFVTPENRRVERKVSLFKRWVIEEVADATRCIAGRGQDQDRSAG